MIKLPALKNMFEEAQIAFLRFPWVILCGIFATLVAIYNVEAENTTQNLPIILIFLLGLPLFLSIYLFIEAKKIQKNKQYLFILGGMIYLLLNYFVFRLDDTKNFELKYVQLSLAIHLLVSFVAYWNDKSNLNFWQLNKNIFLRILVSFLYSAVFYFGITVAVVATGYLFSIDIYKNLYLEFWFLSAFILQTWHFLAGLPKDINNLDAIYPKELKIFVQYLLIPLVSLYMIILYIYMGKIIITRVWPQGYVGWLVSIIAVLGVFNLLLLDPEKNKIGNEWIKKYSRAFYILIIPLLIMLFIAVGLRIGEYGITEKRYFLLMLSGWLFCISFYFIFSQKKNIKMIPISLFIILVISNRGPWNAFSVSMRSQLTRVESILQKNNMLIDGKAVAAKNQISAKDEFELTTILNYLIQQHTFHSLDGLFPSHLLEKKQSENEFSDSYLFSKNQNSSELMKYLGLNYRSYLNDLRSVSFSHSLTYSNAGVNLAGYKYMFVVGNYDEEIILDGKKLKLLFNDEHLNVYENDKIVQKISFIDFASKLFAENNSDMYRSLTQDKMEIPVKIDKAEALLLLTNVSGTKKDDKIEITTISGYLFVK